MEKRRFALLDLLKAAGDSSFDVALSSPLYVCLSADGTGEKLRVDEVKFIQPRGRRRAAVLLLPAYQRPEPAKVNKRNVVEDAHAFPVVTTR